MNDKKQAGRDSGGLSAEGPTIHVAPSGTLSVELADLAPYFLSEEEVRGYLPTEEEVLSYIEREAQVYIKEARANIARGQ